MQKYRLYCFSQVLCYSDEVTRAEVFCRHCNHFEAKAQETEVAAVQVAREVLQGAARRQNEP